MSRRSTGGWNLAGARNFGTLPYAAVNRGFAYSSNRYEKPAS